MSREKREREAAAEARTEGDEAEHATETDDSFIDADETLESEEEPG